jgi:hypothetical protein
MRKLFALLAIAVTASANDLSIKTLQSGPNGLTTPIFDHGIHGEGQIIAVLDTGVDYTSCYFAEPDGATPPINTVDLSRRKIVAYDFLYDNPNSPNAYDNQGHGTHAAASAVGDRGTPIVHDPGDAIAPGAKLIVQDAGYTGGDACSQRPGIGCPVNITPILDQAYQQGARIHSNSWGDAQGSPFAPPTANYPQSARDVDAFVYSHPDMLIVFNTGNWSGTTSLAPPSSLSAPGAAKNTLDVGGTRDANRYADDVLARFTLFGPTRDGRIKPDVVGPAYVVAGDAQVITNGNTCGTTPQLGTSWAAPTIAGAAALVRQYYTDGFYPTGIATPANRMTPSAALLKATIIAAARRVPQIVTPTGLQDTKPVPSNEQGWGFPVLDDALYFPGDVSKLRVQDNQSLAEGESNTMQLNVKLDAPLKVILVWTDPPGVPLVNDLDLRVVDPAGNQLAPADHVNNVEGVSVAQPLSGNYTITVSASRLGQGRRQNYALVVTGDVADAVPPQPLRTRAARH